MKACLCLAIVVAVDAFADINVIVGTKENTLFSVEPSDSLLLLQSHADVSTSQFAGKKVQESKTHPREPETLFTEMSSHVGALEDTMAMVQRTHNDKIQTLRAEYDKNLAAQMEEIRLIGQANEQLAADVRGTEKQNEYLRHRASTLLRQNHEMVEDVKVLQGTFSSQRDLAADALERSKAKLLSSPELKVLDESDHPGAPRSRNKFSALQFNMSVAAMPKGVKGDMAGGLMNLVKGALSELAEEQQVSESMLRSHFQKQYSAGKARRAELLQQQKELAKKKTVVVALNNRLRAAVQHLEGVYANLREQAQSLRAVSKRLSAKPLPEEEEDDPQSTELVEEGSHASELKEFLAEVNREVKRSMADQGPEQ